MKLTICLLSFALSSLANPLFLGGQEIILEDTKVPGDNPLYFCTGSPSEDLLIVDHVNLLPNPPVAGETLSIDAAGNFTQRVEDGAYVVLTVKYGLITLIKTKENLCEQLANVDKECPVEKGEMKVTKQVDLPSQVPPGKYFVQADVYNENDERLTCMTATVRFGS
ncbi:Phosphatidylglycerol/phosphatidylinositol transfer protein [Trapelia coarctata]|nr:Phosphatidylglycerol/phosphatidylinositol transfer protein [Trapelia coarctata]